MHVPARRVHGTLFALHSNTVAILAQGTNRGDALCAALLFARDGSDPRMGVFSFKVTWCPNYLLIREVHSDPILSGVVATQRGNSGQNRVTVDLTDLPTRNPGQAKRGAFGPPTDP